MTEKTKTVFNVLKMKRVTVNEKELIDTDMKWGFMAVIAVLTFIPGYIFIFRDVLIGFMKAIGSFSNEKVRILFWDESTADFVFTLTLIATIGTCIYKQLVEVKKAKRRHNISKLDGTK